MRVGEKVVTSVAEIAWAALCTSCGVKFFPLKSTPAKPFTLESNKPDATYYQSHNNNDIDQQNPSQPPFSKGRSYPSLA